VPRELSYAIDCGTRSHSDANSTSKLTRPEQTSKSVEDRVIVFSPDDINRASASAEFNQADEHYDPLSVVLDCQFCGACVALWPFTLVERPLQLFKLVSDSRQDDQDNGHPSLGSGVEPSKSANIGFNFTIAGGPPPTRQSFRPKVSFPIVSRHLKADLNSRGISHSSVSDTDMVPVPSHASGPLKRKRSMDQHHMLKDDNATSNNVDASTKGDNSVRNTTNVKVNTEREKGGSHSDTEKVTSVCETSNEEETTCGSLARRCVASTDVALEQQGPEPNSPPVQGTRVENSDAGNLTETPAYSSMPTEVGTIAKSFVDWEKGACKPSGEVLISSYLLQLKGIDVTKLDSVRKLKRMELERK
jgi:hypothetical protein